MTFDGYSDEAVSLKLAELDQKSFLSYTHALERLLSEAQSPAEQDVLKALIDICRLSYGREDGHPPYVPMFVPADEQPVLKIDKDKYEILSSVVDKISNAKLRARVADVLWCAERDGVARNDIKFALVALNAYKELEVDEKRWFADGQDGDWRRALKLGKSIGKAGEAIYLDVVAKLTKAYDDATDSGGVENMLRRAIPSLLAENGLNKVIPPEKIAYGFKKLIDEVLVSNPKDYYSLQVYSRSEADWFRIAGDCDAACDALCALATFYMEEAEAESKVDDPIWFRVADRYGMAISTYAQMSKEYRKNKGLDRLCDQAKIEYEAAVRKGADGMTGVNTASVDVTMMSRQAKEFVAGQEKGEALRRLIRMVEIRQSEVELNAAKLLASSITAKIMPSKSVTPDGRVVAVAPADSCVDDAAHEKRLQMEVVRYAAFEVQFQCGAVLKPAYDVIVAEHGLTLKDFTEIVEESPLIPKFHKRIYAEGLYLGFTGDFTAATYILAPEIENCIRAELKARGFITTSYESSPGLQTEVGLSTLIKNHNEGMVVAFSKDFVFLLDAIFANHFGPNIRNEVAHGLKTDVGFNGYMDMFVWWFALRLSYLRLSVHQQNRTHVKK